MITWERFRDEVPELASAVRALLYPFGSVGLGMLATVRRDGGPRVHPMCPMVTDERLFAFIEPGPKRTDLHRDGRYALHCFPPADNEDAAYVTGTATPVTGREVVAAAAEQWLSERGLTDVPPGFGRDELFELLIDRCLVTRTTGHGDWEPRHTVWHAGAGIIVRDGHEVRRP